MKRTIFISLLLALVSVAGWSQTSYFDKFENMHGVDYVRYKGDNLKKKIKYNDNVIDVRTIADKVNYVVAISMNKPVFVKGYPESHDDGMTTEVVEAHASLKYLKEEYVQLMRSQDKHEFVGIYYKDKATEGFEYVIYDEEKEELNIVVISSVLKPEEIAKMLKN